MKYNNFIRLSKACLGIYAQKLTLIFALSLFTFISSAQDNLWVVGNQLVDFNDPNNVSTSTLPQPNLATSDPAYPYTYHGEIAEYAQNAVWDHNGELLFFIIDGYIYDAQGYMLVDEFTTNPLFQNGCLTCISAPEPSELIISKVPGNCSQYYIITGTSDKNIQINILDLDLPNTYYGTNRQGSLINFYTGNTNVPASYSDFFNQPLPNFPSIDWKRDNTNGNYVLGNIASRQNTPGTQQISNFLPTAVLRYPISSGSDEDEEGLHFELVDPGLNLNKQLYVWSRACMSRYEVRSNGIFFMDLKSDQDIGSGHYREQIEEVDAGNYNQQKYLIAAQMHNNDQIIKININNDQTLGNSTGYDIEPLFTSSLGIGSVSGVETSENGRYIYFLAHDADPINTDVVLGVIDIVTNTIQSVSGLTPISNLSSLRGGQLEKGYYQGNESIFISGPSGLSILSNVNDLTQLTYTANAFSIAPMASTTTSSQPTPLADGQNMSNAYILPNQNTGNSYGAALEEEECCEFRNRVQAYDDQSFSTSIQVSSNWSPGNNPFDNTSDPIQITGDLVFEQGRYNITDMTFEFSPESNVIIMPGARVTLYGTTWTSFTCDELMWPGANIIGDTDTPQNLLFSPFPDPSRGSLEVFSNSVIENAMIGVQVGTNSVNAGGVLRGVASTFRNNRQDVDFRAYSVVNEYYQTFWDLSYFQNCTFITDGPLKNENLFPTYHATLQETYHVDFFDCSFINSTLIEDFNYSQRGMGILSWNALYEVIGSNESYDGEDDTDATAFHQLNYGAIILGQNPVRINSMEFSDNFTGIAAMGARITEITENNFYVPNLYTTAQSDLQNYLPKAVYMINSTHYTIEANHTYGSTDPNNYLELGFVIRNSGDYENEVYHNNFENMFCGIYVLDDNLAEDIGGGLQARCNIFDAVNYDIYLGGYSSWRDDQGEVVNLQSLANNKFSVPIGCETDYHDLVYNADVFANTSNPDWFTEYHCIPDDELCVPNCESPNLGVAENSSFQDQSWDEVLMCPTSLDEYNWPDIPSLNMEGMVLFNNSKADLASARNLLSITVDNGEKVDLLAEINAAFPHESSFLRNLLLQKYPLSNEVMRTVITRAEPMDPWHLTQVLIANSKLDKELLIFLEDSEVLSDFFMAFIYDAQLNSAESLKRLLEREVSYRSYKTYQAKQRLVRYFNFQLNQDQNNSAYITFLEDQNEDWARELLINDAVTKKDATAVNLLMAEIEDLHSDYETLTNIRLAMSSDTELTTAEINQLWGIYNKGETQYGDAGAILFWIGELDSFPAVELPSADPKSLQHQVTPSLSETDWIQAFPNPAHKTTFISYPSEIDGNGEIKVFNSLGQVVFSTVPNSKGVLELDISDYVKGVYIITFTFNGEQIDELKLIKQ